MNLIKAIRTYMRYPPMLFWPAIRSRLARNAWRSELDAQPTWREAFERAHFSHRFTARHAPVWWGAFKDSRNEVRDYLELGSWEGQSAVLAAWLFPQAHITAVDWFANIEANTAFDFNVQPFADRLEKVKGTSLDVLRCFAAEGRRFDLIYIDADHRFDSILLDTILSWQLLRVGGFLLWDDYLWSHKDVPRRFNPKLAVDTWLETRSPAVKVVFAGSQVCVKKTAEDPTLRDMSGKLIVGGLD